MNSIRKHLKYQWRDVLFQFFIKKKYTALSTNKKSGGEFPLQALGDVNTCP